MIDLNVKTTKNDPGNLFMLLYQLAKMLCIPPFEIKGYVDLETALFSTKGLPIYCKPIVEVDGKLAFIIGMHEAKGGERYFSTIGNKYFLKESDQDKITRRIMYQMRYDLSNIKTVETSNGILYHFNDNYYNLDDTDIKHAMFLFNLKRRQYKDRIELWSDDGHISTKNRE